MSRLGKKPIGVPAGVEVKVGEGRVTTKGPKGNLARDVPSCLRVEFDPGRRELKVDCREESTFGKSQWGLHRALLANMVVGVHQGFERKLEVHGLGFTARVDGETLFLGVGYVNPVVVKIPKDLTVEVPKTKDSAKDRVVIAIKGCDRQAVGQFAATVRAIKPTEPYKGTGIRYENEVVRRKQGKAFVGSQGS